MRLKAEGYYYEGYPSETRWATFEIPSGQMSWVPPPGFIVTQVFFEEIGSLPGSLPPELPKQKGIQ